MEKMESVVGQIASAGYQGVQTFVDMVAQPRSAERYAKLLAKHHLHSAGIYASGPLHDSRTAEPYVTKLAEAVRHARGFLDIRSVTLSPDPLPDKSTKSEAQLQTQIEALKTLSQLLSEQTVRLLYHAGPEELVDTGHEFKWMMRFLPNRMMGLCYDSDNVRRSGQKPGDVLDMFAPRVQETHLRNSKNGVWDEVLADGDVRLQDLVELLDDYDFKGWHIIELAREPQTPRTLTLPESLKRSYLYLQSMLAASNRATRWHYRHS
jgi:inosose dehydratase